MTKPTQEIERITIWDLPFMAGQLEAFSEIEPEFRIGLIAKELKSISTKIKNYVDQEIERRNKPNE